MTDVKSYAELRQEGIRHLERLAGGQWTDFNAHDPGITLLEQMCYTLTDLAYRTRYAVPDLLASGSVSGSTDVYDSLFAADEILTTDPVTLTDLRKRILDVDGVKNAWIEPVTTPEVKLYYHADLAELSQEPDDPLAPEPVELKGLYRVHVEHSDLADVDGTTVRANVGSAVHAHRNLCEDVTEIRILETQDVHVEASIEIDRVDDVDALLLEIFERLAGHVSPAIPFATLEERLAAGATFDQVFEGPRLDKGFVDDEALAAATRRTRLNTSDMIHLLMDIPGVRAVSRLGLAVTDGALEDWSLELDASSTPRLDLETSTITLVREGIPVGVDLVGVMATFEARAKQASAARGVGEPLMPAPGRDRQVARYHSVQHDLPALFGVGALGLPASASPERQARARQLKAYLALFDQLLANAFAQLAHVRDLFSFHGDELATHAVGGPGDDGFGMDEIRAAEYQAQLEAVTGASFGTSFEHRNRFLNHLLSRFAEQMTDYSMVLRDAMPAGETATAAERLARDKQRLLRRFPRISSARGTAFDYLRDNSSEDSSSGDSSSGLEERLRLKLGLADDEPLLLVEHILLRPIEGDDSQTVPLLTAASSRDPYSLQVTAVLLDEPGRMQQPAFRQFVESTLRAETPAHLVLYVLWLVSADFDALSSAYTTWVDKRRAYWTARLGVTS